MSHAYARSLSHEQRMKILDDISRCIVDGKLAWTERGTRADWAAWELERLGFLQGKGRSAAGNFWALMDRSTPEPRDE